MLKILGMVVIGKNGTVVSGTSTNGGVHKIPGLVSLILLRKLVFRFISCVMLFHRNISLYFRE